MIIRKRERRGNEDKKKSDQFCAYIRGRVCVCVRERERERERERGGGGVVGSV